MVNKKTGWGMLVIAFIICCCLTSCWSTGKARAVLPVTAVTLQRVKADFGSDLIMKVFVDNVPYELENSMTINIIVNNGEHLVYAVLGDLESKAIRFTADYHTIVVNVTPNRPVIGRNTLEIEVDEA
jgi:ketosteroid isomerase-like protein